MKLSFNKSNYRSSVERNPSGGAKAVAFLGLQNRIPRLLKARSINTLRRPLLKVNRADALGKKQVAATFSEDFERLSKWLSQIQLVFLKFDYDTTYIGGSSAREILDHILWGAPLALRDLDIYLIKGSTVMPADVQTIAEQIEGQGIAVLGEERIREKIRANPQLNAVDRYAYAAGLGAHMFAKQQPILSLGMFHGRSDLDLNGLFDIDRIYLKLDNFSTLSEFAKIVLAARGNLNELTTHGHIYDPTSGYTAWRNLNPQLVNWPELQRNNANGLIRIVRTFAKASRLELDSDFLRVFRQQVPEPAKVKNLREFNRGIIKILGDQYWAHELSMLARLNAFQEFSPSFQYYLEQNSAAYLLNLAQTDVGWAAQNKQELACHRLVCVLREYEGDDKEQIMSHLNSVVTTVFGAH